MISWKDSVGLSVPFVSDDISGEIFIDSIDGDKLTVTYDGFQTQII